MNIDPRHPVWPLLRITVMLAFLTLILYITAHNFDATELRTIIGMFLAGAAAEGVPAMLSKFTGGNKGSCD